jgi:hypothetical protein
MSRLRDKSALVPSLLLALLLLGAHAASLAHAYQHEPGTPQNKTCTLCIAASQLASACVDTHACASVEIHQASRSASQDIDFDTLHTITVRQRGPPATL